MIIGFILVVAGLILSIVFTEIQRQMIFNTTIQIGDYSITTIQTGLACMGIGTFLILKEYWKITKPISSNSTI